MIKNKRSIRETNDDKRTDAKSERQTKKTDVRARNESRKNIKSKNKK